MRRLLPRPKRTACTRNDRMLLNEYPEREMAVLASTGQPLSSVLLLHRGTAISSLVCLQTAIAAVSTRLPQAFGESCFLVRIYLFRLGALQKAQRCQLRGAARRIRAFRSQLNRFVL